MTGERATIFALASGAGIAGVAVIRVSGPAAGAVLGRLSGRDLPPPRAATYMEFCAPADGRPLDSGLGIWFPGPASYTGEDIAEFHIHGGVASIRAMLSALDGFDGLRLAEPGEFTRRAFDNGKLDLTGVEALSDLIAAETEMQRRQALRQLGGEFGERCEQWRRELIDILARLEAWIDFPDEELPDDLFSETKHQIKRFYEEICRYVDDDRAGERVRDGLMIAIIGPPNAGKSSLLNKLAGRAAAIVSEKAGTTRDIVEVRCDIAGLPVTLADTAGLRAAEEDIEEEGVRRAESLAASADLCIAVEAPDCPPLDRAALEKQRGDGAKDILFVLNKNDLKIAAGPHSGADVSISAKTGDGFDGLFDHLEARIKGLVPERASAPVTRRRHRAALEACRAALDRAAAGTEIELIAEDMRVAARSLGRITGRVDVEDVLDRLFGEFCIGK